MKILIVEPFLLPNSPAGSQYLKLAISFSSEVEVAVLSIESHDLLLNKVEQLLPTDKVKTAKMSRRKILDLLNHKLNAIYMRFDAILINASWCEIARNIRCENIIITFHSCPVEALNIMRRGGMRYKGGNIKLIMQYNFYKRIALEMAVKSSGFLAGKDGLTWVAVSKGLVSDIEKNYRHIRDVHVIHNSVDLIERNNEIEQIQNKKVVSDYQSRFRQDGLTALMVAQGNWAWKGIFPILESFKEITNVNLVVVGGGPTEALKHHCDRMGVSHKVYFAGFQNNVKDFYHNADIFIMASYYESFSLVALEAARFALPILSTPVHGIKDWLQEGYNGFFIDHNPTNIAQKISFLVRNPTVRASLGKNAQQTSLRFSTDSMKKKYSQLIQRES